MEQETVRETVRETAMEMEMGLETAMELETAVGEHGARVARNMEYN